MRTKRKTICRILAALTAVLILAACSKTTPEKEDKHVFRATVSEKNQDTLLVVPLEGSEELKSSDLFSIGIGDMVLTPEPGVGDVIEITYSGDILETYPASLTGITGIDIVFKAPLKDENSSADTEEEPSESPAEDRVAVNGPYGELSIAPAAGWNVEVCPPDEGLLTYGMYGLILKKDQVPAGRLEIFCQPDFAVCGTGLKQEEITLAGSSARQGTFDDHKIWDFIAFEGDKEGVVAQLYECEEWDPDLAKEALGILDTIEFRPDLAEGGAWEFVPESENQEIAVEMELHKVTPEGAVVCFYQYDNEDRGELLYGNAFTLLKKEGDEWTVMEPTIEEEWAWEDEGFPILPGEKSEMETNWEWLFGKLEPGTYRIRKSVWLLSESGNKEYVLEAQFFIA